MSKQNRFEKASSQTQDEAIKATLATQRPGQAKEQTKLIAQGVKKGIDHYKKQQKSKSRELNKKRRKPSQPALPDNENTPTYTQEKNTKKLPWILLLISWIGFITYYFSVNN